MTQPLVPDNTHTLPTDPVVLEKLKGCITEISDAMTRIASNRDLIKESIKSFNADYKVDKKVIRALAKAYYKDDMKKKMEEATDIAELYARTFKVDLDDVLGNSDED